MPAQPPTLSDDFPPVGPTPVRLPAIPPPLPARELPTIDGRYEVYAATASLIGLALAALSFVAVSRLLGYLFAVVTMLCGLATWLE